MRSGGMEQGVGLATRQSPGAARSALAAHQVSLALLEARAALVLSVVVASARPARLREDRGGTVRRKETASKTTSKAWHSLPFMRSPLVRIMLRQGDHFLPRTPTAE